MKTNVMLILLLWFTVSVATVQERVDWENWSRLTAVVILALAFSGTSVNASIQTKLGSDKDDVK